MAWHGHGHGHGPGGWSSRPRPGPSSDGGRAPWCAPGPRRRGGSRPDRAVREGRRGRVGKRVRGGRVARGGPIGWPCRCRARERWRGRMGREEGPGRKGRASRAEKLALLTAHESKWEDGSGRVRAEGPREEGREVGPAGREASRAETPFTYLAWTCWGQSVRALWVQPVCWSNDSAGRLQGLASSAFSGSGVVGWWPRGGMALPEASVLGLGPTAK